MSSPSPSPSDVPIPAQLEITLDALDSLTRTYVLPVIIATLLFGMFTLLIIFSTYTLLRRGLDTSKKKALLVVTLAMYTVSAMQIGLDISATWNDLTVQIPSIARTGAQTPTNHALDSLDNALVSINIVLSDAVVLWRACIVWENNRAVVASSGMLVFVILIFNIYIVIQDEIESLKIFIGGVPVVPLVSLCISLASNVWSTVLIAYRAWGQRRDFKEHVQSSKSVVASVLLMLVESSFLYCCLWTLNILANVTDVLGSFGPYMIHTMTQLTAMYPTLIILIVFLRKSHGYGDSQPALDTSIAFAGPGRCSLQQARHHRSANFTSMQNCTFNRRSFTILPVRDRESSQTRTADGDAKSFGEERDSREGREHTPEGVDEKPEMQGQTEVV